MVYLSRARVCAAVAAILCASCEPDADWTQARGIDRAVDFNAVWGSSAEDVWAVGGIDGGPAVWRYDGSRWQEQAPPATSGELDDIWGAAGQVWVTGHGGVYRYTDGGWSGWPEVDAVALWGTGPEEVFATGSRRVWRWDGTVWVEETQAGSLAEADDLELVAAWGVSAESLWIVGGRVVCECGETTALYHSAEAWSLVSLRTEMFAQAIWGTGAQDVYAVGGAVFTAEGSGVFHYDGTDWSQVTSGRSEFLAGVWGTSADDVFAVGLEGEILRFDGSSWSRMKSGTSQSLRDVWGEPVGGMYAVGTGGTVLRYRP